MGPVPPAVRHAAAVLRAYLARGCLGASVDLAAAVEDLCRFVDEAVEAGEPEPDAEQRRAA